MNYELISIDSEFSLAHDVARLLERDLIFPQVVTFADGEFEINLPEEISFDRKMVVILQSTYRPVHENIMKLALTLHALKNAGATVCFAVVPYFSYSRQGANALDKQKPGQAAVVASLLMAGGLDALVTVDLHAQKLADYFFGPVASLSLAQEIGEHIKNKCASMGVPLEDICLVSPDAGAQKRVQEIARQVGCSYRCFDKDRYAPNKTKIISGAENDHQGSFAIIIDDICDTGGTVLAVAEELKSAGYSRIWGYFVHPVFSGDAQEKIDRSSFEKVFVFDTIPVTIESGKIECLSAARVLSESIPQLPALLICGSEFKRCADSCGDCSEE